MGTQSGWFLDWKGAGVLQDSSLNLDVNVYLQHAAADKHWNISEYLNISASEMFYTQSVKDIIVFLLSRSLTSV